MLEWHRVKDELPENGEVVIVKMPGNCGLAGFLAVRRNEHWEDVVQEWVEIDQDDRWAYINMHEKYEDGD